MSAFSGMGMHRERNFSMIDADNSKRRSSSRNIKRPKFDDELVESSLGGQGMTPPPKINRPKTQAVSVPETQVAHSSASTPTTSNKKNRKGKQPSAIQTKDLGRWKPTDDLVLILGVQQTCDLVTVHRGIKFSCKFTLGEIQERWYALLYDPTVSRVAQLAMKNLHPEQISAIEAKALFSKAEEETLGTLKISSTPTIETFQNLLQQHPEIFHVGRTAKSLMSHWQQLKQYYLLPEQNPLSSQRAGASREFTEIEQQIIDSDLFETPDPNLNHELSLVSKQNKMEIRRLEDKVTHLNVLVDTVMGITPPDFDTNTLAVLKGRLVRYLMRSENITLGRKAKGCPVDVDLTLEGPAWKVSRRQGVISLQDDGEFVLHNEGKRPIYVDGKPVTTSASNRLLNNSVIEISSLKFIFLINAGLVNKSKLESLTPKAIVEEDKQATESGAL